jgi:hypothetical protein
LAFELNVASFSSALPAPVQPRDQVRFAAAQAKLVRESVRSGAASGRIDRAVECGGFTARLDADDALSQVREVAFEALLARADSREPTRDLGKLAPQLKHARFQLAIASTQVHEAPHGASRDAQGSQRQHAREQHEN